MQLLKKAIVLLAMGIAISACSSSSGGPGANGGGNHPVDRKAYPTVENSILGAWDSGSEVDDKGVLIIRKFFFNSSNEVAIEVTCSIGSDSIVASASASATITATQVVISIGAEDYVEGTLGGQNFECGAVLEAITLNYRVQGDQGAIDDGSESVTITRIR
jgi:hypothetical protein